MKSTLLLNADCQPMGLVPISTKSWKDAVVDFFNDKVTILHEYADWEIHSPSTTLRVPSVVMVREFKTTRKRVGFTAHNVFARDLYTCQYCRLQFPYEDLTYDHVTPRSLGGKTGWLNISTACGPCNRNRAADIRIRPAKEPHKPTYWELADKVKNFPIVVPDESWAYYLDWKPELVSISRRKY